MATVIIVACLLLAGGGVRRGWAAVSCGQVVVAVGPCLAYVRGAGPLTPGCCNGVRSLNSRASSTPDRQQACACLKQLAGGIPGLKPALALGLPGKCNVNVPFPISTSTDCSKVH